MLPLTSLFEQFLRERRYLKNVTPKTEAWYQSAFDALPRTVQRDKTHFANVSADEWQAVQQFARERTLEVQAERGEVGLLGAIMWSVLLLPILVLCALVVPVVALFRWLRYRLRGPRRERAGTVADNILVGETPARNCTVPECGGTMRFHPRQQEASALHTLEWPWRATWVCETNPAHIEVATRAEEKALSGRPER